MRDLIIVGGGPAGITAGIYAARQQLDTLILTKKVGGQITTKAVPIENYPGFSEVESTKLVKRFEEQVKQLGADINYEEVAQINKQQQGFEVVTENGNFEAKTIIIATGADPRPLEVPGEKEFIGQGVSYCAVCDGPTFKGKEVAVAGGGNAGFETALFLSQYAEKITILEYLPEVQADSVNQKEVNKKDSIEIVTNVELKEIKGDDFVNSVIYENRKTGQEETLDLSAVFIEVGRQPATSFVSDLVEFNEKDEIKVNQDTGATQTPGLFAAGDVTNVKFKQIVIAAGQGAKAALGANQYLQQA